MSESRTKKIRLQISNMSCIQCQHKIEAVLNQQNGVVKAKVSYAKGIAEILFYPQVIQEKEIIAVIEALGYFASFCSKARMNWIRNTCLLIIIFTLYLILQMLGILNRLTPGTLSVVPASYGMFFTTGLFTSVHCVAMCGGISLSQCLAIPKKSKPASKWSLFLPALSYNLGRVAAYTLIGFLLGMAGSLFGLTKIGSSTILQGILKMIIGVLMGIMGLNMLSSFPWLRRFTIRIPGFFYRKIAARRKTAQSAFVIGALNGLMPCGPLQTMWLSALAAGSGLNGALIMLLFGLGTVWLMLGFGMIVTVLGKQFSEKMLTAGAVMIAVLGLAMISQGAALSGILSEDLLTLFIAALTGIGILLSIDPKSFFGKAAVFGCSLLIFIGCYPAWKAYDSWKIRNMTAAENEARIIDGIQVVNSTLEPGQYPTITVQAKVPVKWIIYASKEDINGCNYKLIIQQYGIEVTLVPGENIIEFIPDEAGIISYSCWMGMIRGSIYVMEGKE